MILIIGGKAQGKREFALNELKIAEIDIIDDIDELIYELLCQGEEPNACLDNLIAKEKPKCIICREVGQGIAPMTEIDRNYREVVGRYMTRLAREAEAVYRVYAGIGIRIK